MSPGRTTQPSRPSISFVLLTLAVIAVGTGAITWALVRPEPREVKIFLPTPGPIVVHVTGVVANPGVYTLEPHSRASDAVDMAGGLIEPSGINLAALLRDGQQLVVSPVNTDNDTADAVSAATQSPNILLDLNTASAAQLEQLPNIGPARASAIISFRERNGQILFVDDLTAIDGIGPAIAEALRPLVVQP